jgi:NAD(P)-dependent dehydrogenase (short-subunit alcohol dehydrogenase family)
VDFEDEPRRGMPEGTLRGDGRYEPGVAYGQSKTANVLFSVALNSRGVKSFAVMPGSTYQWTDISLFGMNAYRLLVAIATDLTREMDEQGIKGLTEGQFDW